MASLTQGVLSKLLKHANDKEIKVTGEHRSALLQVIEILPSVASGDDPWQSRGFYLKVSDSLHSTYVSIAKEDADLIFSDKIQLGQFIHVTRFDSASPFPVLRGVKPVARRRECVGNPTDLTAAESLPFRMNVDFSTLRKDLKKDAAATKRKTDLKMRRGSIGNVKVEEMEVRRLSLDSMRRGWEKSPSPRSNVAMRSKEILVSCDSPSVRSGKALLRKDSPSKHCPSNNSPLKSKNNLPSLNAIREPLKADIKAPKECITRRNLIEVPLNVRSSYDQIMLWDSLPSDIHELGKGTICQRDAALLATVDALQEASAAESVIRYMSMFAELSDSAQQESPGFLVEIFLDLHQSIQQAGSVVDALLVTRSVQANTGSVTTSQIPSLEVCKCFSDRNADATLWAQAALEADLSRFSLFSNQDKGTQHGHHNYVVLETPPETTELQVKNQSSQNRKSPKNQGGIVDSCIRKGQSSKRRVGVSPRKNTKDEKMEWSKGRGLEAVASLAKKLLTVSREWFLKYLEDSLNDGFRSRLGKGGNEVANLLGQLKRVNQWLEDAVGNGFEIDERVECLRRKLYNFLLEHVDSSISAGR